MRARLVLLCTSLAVAGACGGSETSTAGEPAEQATAPTGLVVSVERSRLFEQRRAMAVTVENRGEATAVLVDPSLESGRYEPADPPARTVTVDPGQRLTFPLPYGPARCDSDADEVIVHATVDGAPARFEAAATDPIRGAHRRECAAERARAAVDLGFGDDWTADGATATGTLTVRPVHPDVAVVDVQTAIVFVTEVGASLPATSDVTVGVTARRCDVHALIESKKTFTVAVHVQVGDEAPVPVELAATQGPVRAALDRAIEACVAASPAG